MQLRNRSERLVRDLLRHFVGGAGACGIAALAVSCAPSATKTQIERALELSAVPIGSTVRYGRADAYHALTPLGCGGGSTTPVTTPPTSTVTPSVSGTPEDGQTLTALSGTWGGTTPMTFGYEWSRCATGGSCTAIAGATGEAYLVSSLDVGLTLAVTVTANNAAGSALGVECSHSGRRARSCRPVA